MSQLFQRRVIRSSCRQPRVTLPGPPDPPDGPPHLVLPSTCTAISSALQSHAPWGMRWGHLLPLQTLAVTFLRRMGAMTVSSTTFLSPHAFYSAILQPRHRTARRLPSQLLRVVDRYCLHQAWSTASMHLRQTSGDSHQVLQLLRTQRTSSPASLEPIIHSPGRSLALVSLLILLSSFFGFGLRFF